MSLCNEIEKILDIDRNMDLYHRVIYFDEEDISIYFFTSIIDEEQLNSLIRFMSLDNGRIRVKDKSVKISISDNINEIVNRVLDGNVLFVTSRFNYLIDLKKYALRGIQEPNIEKTIRGSRDGFNESIINNISLIRMRIKSPKLRIESLFVGKETKTQVALIYLESEVDSDNLFWLRTKIFSLNLDSLIMTDRALEENIFKQIKTIYPIVRYTERPDVASIHIINGKFVLIVDGSPSSIITPVSLFDHLKHVEEFRLNPLAGVFTKILRFVASLLSLFLIPTIYLMQTNNFQINIFSYYVENDAFFPLSIQYIFCSLIVEVFRIAIIHTPNTLVTALSIVIGIIFGELSISTGLFIPEVLLIVALSTTCSFSIPSYELSMSNKLLMIFFLFIASIFGLEGYLIVVLICFIKISSIKVLGVPFLSPLIPFRRKEFFDILIRTDASMKKKV